MYNFVLKTYFELYIRVHLIYTYNKKIVKQKNLGNYPNREYTNKNTYIKIKQNKNKIKKDVNLIFTSHHIGIF